MKSLAISALFILVSTTFAQVNIEKYNNLNSANGVISKISVYFNSKTGNTDIQEFGLDSRLSYMGEGLHTLMIGQGSLGWKDGKQYSNNALIHLRFLKEFQSIISPEVFTQIDYDKKRLLLFRSLVGGGVRFSLFKDSLASFNYGSSYMFEYEKLDLPENSNHLNQTYNSRWNNYISYSNFISSNSRFSLAVYFQPRFDKFNDFRILSENFISVNISSKLAISLNFSLRYDSKPPDTIKNFDTNISMGITINL
jgi:hypothetical protein